MVGPANQPELAKSYVCPSCGRQYDKQLDFCPHDGVRLLASDENSMSRVGAVIGGRYHVDRVLGHGGMGTVFRAVQQPIGRRVAIKVLHPELAQDETFVTRFHTEAKAASVLVNPNTVTIYDFGQTEDGTLFIAMEYLEGVSLADRLGRGALPWHHAVTIGVQVCRALSEAHRKGIVHRDLKPENIMLVAADDGSLLVKVLDFGIAKMLSVPGRTLKGVPVTQVGVIIGTPQYMSPEQARGGEPRPASDLYALGVILHEAISGATPFDDEEPILLLGKHMKAPPPPVTSPFGAYPPLLGQLILQLMEKEPTRRPGPAGEVGVALRKITGDITVTAAEVLGSIKPSAPPVTPLSAADDGGAISAVDPVSVEGLSSEDDTDETNLRETLERPPPDLDELEAAPTALNPLPEAPVPGGSVDLDRPAIQMLSDEDFDDDIGDLPGEATRRIEYSPIEEETSRPREDDKTTMRSVVVDPVPPDAAGLRPDQVLPDEAPTRGALALEGGWGPEVEEAEDAPSRKGLIVGILVVLFVLVAGAVTGVIIMMGSGADGGASGPDPSLIASSSGGGELPSGPTSPTPAPTKVEPPAAPAGVTDNAASPPQPDADVPVLEPSRVKSVPGEEAPPTSADEDLAEVLIKSSPSGAKVFIRDDLLCNVTPCRTKLPRGKRVRLRLERPGGPIRTRTIVPGRDKVIRVTLRRSHGSANTKTKSGGLPLWLD